jgi:glycosyltransferase involved in cell wall biosynthesis
VIRIAFICPTFNAVGLHKYTARALTSFLETTPSGVAIVIDDGSAGFIDGYGESLHRLPGVAPNRLHTLGFPTKGGLTRSWNAGLEMASQLNADYAIAGNNDVVFTPKWYEGLLHALTNGYSLVGPLSNAPGITANGLQEITRSIPDYRLSDDSAELVRVAEKIRTDNLGKVVESPVNGFFTMASMQKWCEGKYDDKHFFRPLNLHYSNGKPNPTPDMTGNEDELQRRWHNKGWKSAVVLSSFIFHYRAVSRGQRYKKGLWYRA